MAQAYHRGGPPAVWSRAGGLATCAYVRLLVVDLPPDLAAVAPVCTSQAPAVCRVGSESRGPVEPETLCRATTYRYVRGTAGRFVQAAFHALVTACHPHHAAACQVTACLATACPATACPATADWATVCQVTVCWATACRALVLLPAAGCGLAHSVLLAAAGRGVAGSVRAADPAVAATPGLLGAP